MHCCYHIRNSWKAQSRGDGYSPSGTLGGTRLVGGARSTSTVFALGVTERRVVFSSRCLTGANAVPRILDIARIMRFAVVLLCRGTRFTAARRHETCRACPKTFDFYRAEISIELEITNSPPPIKILIITTKVLLSAGRLLNNFGHY